MTRYLIQMKPKTLDHIIAMVALYRPGPMAFIPDYIARMHGEAPVEYRHPAMAPIFDSTYGIPVYQEQLMRAAVELAGYSPSESDELRKAISKKKKDEIEKHRKKFVERCRQAGHGKGHCRSASMRTGKSSHVTASTRATPPITASIAVRDRLPEGQLSRRVYGCLAFGFGRGHREGRTLCGGCAQHGCTRFCRRTSMPPAGISRSRILTAKPTIRFGLGRDQEPGQGRDGSRARGAAEERRSSRT